VAVPEESRPTCASFQMDGGPQGPSCAEELPVSSGDMMDEWVYGNGVVLPACGPRKRDKQHAVLAVERGYAFFFIRCLSNTHTHTHTHTHSTISSGRPDSMGLYSQTYVIHRQKRLACRLHRSSSPDIMRVYIYKDMSY